jgi:hypothetical protein
MATQWTEGLGITRTLSYLGLIAGLALGYSRFSPRVAVLFALVYGAFAVPWRLGLTLGEGVLWAERLGSLAGRLSVTANQLIRQQPVTDNLLFLTLMSALFWTLSVHAGYSLTRYASPWRAVLPTGIAMVVIHSYDAYPAPVLVPGALPVLFLLLVARLVFTPPLALGAEPDVHAPAAGDGLIRRLGSHGGPAPALLDCAGPGREPSGRRDRLAANQTALG